MTRRFATAHGCTRAIVRAIALAAALSSLAPQPVVAQSPVSQLPARSRFSAGMTVERVTFGSGILEADLAGADSSRVLSATGIALPIQFSTVVGGVWLFDAGSHFTTGKRVIVGGDTLSDALSGIGDIRLRLSRRFDRLGFRLTVGANVPTGITGLDASQTAILSVLASPALGMTQPAVGFGAGATVGAVKSFASASRLWGVAVGTSLEWRGEYEPYAALAAGTSIDGYDPGEVIRVSAGATRLFGESKALLTASLDLFGVDQVTASAGAVPVEIQIGPTVSLDAQWLPATTRVRNAALFAALRLRSALSRDGAELPNSGNVVFEAGARGARALSRATDLVFELSGRLLTAVEIDNRLATAASSSVAPSLGLAISLSSWTLQPMLTARIGNVDTGIESGAFRVLGARVMLERRF